MNSLDVFFGSYVASMQTNTLTDFFKVITHLGDKYALVVIFGLILVLVLMRKLFVGRALILFVSVGGAIGVSTILKHLVERARPLNGLVTEMGYAFPSNHATMAIVTYGFCIYLLMRSKISSCIRKILISILVLLILLIGFSRIYLGVHFFSDIMGGYTLGGIFLGLGIWFDKRLSKR